MATQSQKEPKAPLEGRRRAHTAGAVFVASAIATVLAPVLMGMTGSTIGGDYPIGGIGLLFLVIAYAPQVMAIIFLLTAAAGAALRRLRIVHIAFYSAGGALVGLIGVAVLTATALGGGVLVFTTESAVTAALAGAVDGAVYWVVASAISWRRASKI